jgi:hypothetical protein
MSRLWTALEPLLAEDAGPLSIDEMCAYLSRHVPGAGWTRWQTEQRMRREAATRGVAVSDLLRVPDHAAEIKGWPVIVSARIVGQPVSAALLAERLARATGIRWTEHDVRRLVPMAERAHGCRVSCLVSV